MSTNILSLILVQVQSGFSLRRGLLDQFRLVEETARRGKRRLALTARGALYSRHPLFPIPVPEAA